MHKVYSVQDCLAIMPLGHNKLINTGKDSVKQFIFQAGMGKTDMSSVSLSLKNNAFAYFLTFWP